MSADGRQTLSSKREEFIYDGPSDWESRIELNCLKKNGNPCVMDTDVAIYEVLNKLASEKSFKKVRQSLPQLKDGDIESALAFAARSFNWGDSLELGAEEDTITSKRK